MELDYNRLPTNPFLPIAVSEVELISAVTGTVSPSMVFLTTMLVLQEATGVLLAWKVVAPDYIVNYCGIGAAVFKNLDQNDRSS